jgi:hypothetical protein
MGLKFSGILKAGCGLLQKDFLKFFDFSLKFFRNSSDKAVG